MAKRRRAAPGEPIAWMLAHVEHAGDECLIWPFGRFPSGHGVFNEPGAQPTQASRYMCRVAHGEPSDPGLHAAHSCGKAHDGCVNPRHLSWKTPAANIADKIAHGTVQYGERNGQAKLTAAQVEEIRTSAATGRAMAAKFGVSTATISLIRNGLRWAA